MNDKQYESEKKRVHRMVKRWTRTLGLNQWRINCKWRRERFKHKRTIARVEVKWEYQEACIEFSLSKTFNLNDERLEEAVIHELVHVLVAEIADDEAIKHEERVVVTITNAII